MADESIGGISVSIGGDISPLVAAGAKATQVSAQIGSNVAGAFNTSAAGANQFSASTDRLGSSLSAMASEAVAAANAQAGFTAQTEAAAAASAHNITQVQASGAAIRTAFGENSIRAVERFITLIPGLGPALQLAFPIVGAVALFEMLSKVLDKSEKVTEAEKQLAQATKSADDAFLAMAQTIDTLAAKDIGRIFGPAAGAAAEIRAMELKKDDLYKDLQKAKDKLGELATEAQGKILLRPTGGSVIEEEYKPKFEAAGKAIEEAQSKVTEFEARIKDARANAAEVAKSQSGSLTAIEVSNAEKSAERAAEAAKSGALARITAEHDVQQAVIDGLADAGTREIANAEERIRLARQNAAVEITYEQAITKAKVDGINARLAAESRGKPQSEVEKLQTTAKGEVAAVKDEGVQKGLAATRAADEEENRLGAAYATAQRGWADSVTQAWIKSSEERQKAVQKHYAAELSAESFRFEAQQRVAEIQAKGQGRTDELRIQGQKIALEGQYAQQLTHSADEQIAFATRKAALDAQARQAKVTDLEAELKIVQAEALSKDGTEAGVEAAGKQAQIEQQIAQLKQQNANADEQDLNALDQMSQKLNEQLTLQQQIANLKNTASATFQANQQNLGKSLGQSIGNLPKQVGDGIGGAMSDSLLNRHPGKSIGQEMAKELTDALKSALGGILKQGLSSLFQFGLGFLGFADGTDSAPGGYAVVGEKGPEIMHVPRGASIIPNHKIKGYADGVGLGSARSQASTSSRATVAFGDIHFHAHGVSNPRQFAEMAVREIPRVLKARSPQFSPYAT